MSTGQEIRLTSEATYRHRGVKSKRGLRDEKKEQTFQLIILRIEELNRISFKNSMQNIFLREKNNYIQ